MVGNLSLPEWNFGTLTRKEEEIIDKINEIINKLNELENEYKTIHKR